MVMAHARSSDSNAIGLLLDQEKAYDWVHPEYLRRVLQHFRFPNEIKTLTKPIATLASAGGLEYTIQDQQKTLILTEITNLTPIGLLSKQQSYYLLGSPTSQVQGIHEKQPKVIFSIPHNKLSYMESDRSNISNNVYHSASTEWPDGTKSDALYIPTEVINDEPPTLSGIQNIVDQAFMIRLIRYCTRVSERLKVLPVVLVFANMKKKGYGKITEIFIDQSTEQIEKAIKLDEEDPILTAEKCKGVTEQLLEPGKRKSWEKKFNEGKAKGLFTSYTSSNSLKSSYHHAKKREKVKG
ncbi:hypothetical protein BD770DRAFT_440625 [Pilaira anomala]|nr:hypothetical protein BD770DRAFT_440625 [Pilaira anomala]